MHPKREKQMTDSIETPVEEAPVETAETETPGDAPDLSSELEKWKALARKNEQRAKDNSEAAKRLAEIEESQKTEQQKLADAAELARKEAAETAVELAKLRAAVKHGLNDEDLELLGSGTPDEIEARAERLAARLKGNPAPTAPSSDGQGKAGEPVSGAVKQLTRDDLKSMTPAQIEAAHEAGQLNAVQGIAN
jgi:hypothetical protein